MSEQPVYGSRAPQVPVDPSDPSWRWTAARWPVPYPDHDLGPEDTPA